VPAQAGDGRARLFENPNQRRPLMTRKLCWFVLPMLTFALVGCSQTGKMVTCEKCQKKVTVGEYCPKCNKVKGYTGTVHCDKCGKDFAAGEYCAKCNRFMLPGKVHCAKCGMDMPKGAYCGKCKAYMGVEGVRYCPKGKRPVPMAGCTTPCKAEK
jgi:hypothetical protein